MNREEFNNLDICEQVNYFRNKLNEGDNFNAICKRVGISKNTIKPRFAKAGYEEVRQGQIIVGFIKPGEEGTPLTDNVIAPVEIKSSKGVNDNPKKNTNLSDIIKRLEILEQEVKELKYPIEKVQASEFLIGAFNSFTTTKTFKIDIEVYQELEKFMNKYNMYKRQDIISSLLKYALDNIE